MACCEKDYRDASWLSELIYGFASKLIDYTYKSNINADDLWLLRDPELAHENGPILEKIWKSYENTKTKHRMHKTAIGLIGKDYLKALFYKLIWLGAVMFSNTFLIIRLLNEIQSLDPYFSIGSFKIPYWGFLYCGLFFLVEVLRSLALHRHFSLAGRAGMKLRAAVAAMLLRKALRLRKSTDSVGMLLNLFSNDIERLRDGLQFGVFIVSSPLTLIVSIGVGYFFIGISILAGLLVLCISFPAQLFLGKMTSKMRRITVVKTDSRISKLNEILKSIQLIKLYGWEKPFIHRLELEREKEVESLKKTAYVKTFNSTISQTMPLVATFMVFTLHTAILGNELTADQAFSILALFNVTKYALNLFPMSVRFFTEMLVAFGRIETFMGLEEVGALPVLCPPEDALEMVCIQNGKFSWSSSQELMLPKSFRAGALSESKIERDLVIPSLRCHKGSITAVVGPVGSGKSSLLGGALLGEMVILEGTCQLRGPLAYVSQNPWVFNGTLIENILMGNPMDEERFRRCTFACALDADLETLPSGAETEIGERGINISGGQKARLALARAVYSNAEVYILDDILSAVDAHVSIHIWTECIRGLLKEKTILLATHSIQYLPQVDNVIVLRDMRIMAQGVFSKLQENEEIRPYIQNECRSKEHTEPDIEEIMNEVDDDDSNNDAGQTTDIATPENPTVSETPQESTSTNETLNKTEKDTNVSGVLTASEEVKSGSVSWHTIRYFASKTGAAWILAACYGLFWLCEGIQTGGYVWISQWTQNTLNAPSTFYVWVLSIFVGSLILFFAIRGCIFAIVTLRAARTLHNEAFEAIMSAQMYYFHVTPLGRIVARFSADMDKIDVIMVDAAEAVIALSARIVLAIVVITVVLPFFLVAYVPLGWMYWRVLGYFRKVLRNLKRIENLSRSPLISLVQSTSNGLTTARAYDVLSDIATRHDGNIDQTTRAFLAFYMANRWLGVRLDFISNIVVTFCALLIVIFASRLTPGQAGLALTSSLSTAGILQFATRQAADLEAQFTCVERVAHFIENTPQEPKTTPNPNLDLTTWSPNGQVTFEKYSMKYRQGLPLVLKELSIKIPSGSKTAFVGRTGSGKSSTILALFRMMAPDSGAIEIDGVNIETLPLDFLRTKVLSVVPQDPTLFEGTLRYNLDPFNEHTDEEIYDAISKVNLKDFVNSLADVQDMPTSSNPSLNTSGGSDPLMYSIEACGANLSVGQRQLFCFARALLRNTPVICIDEGTSSVDDKSDQIIQQTLRQAFPNRTLIVVAHRLNTIINFDYICVLKNGSCLEFGSPEALLENSQSAFSKMWQSYQCV